MTRPDTLAGQLRTYWCSGGDVMMRQDGVTCRLSPPVQAYHMGLLEDERRAAEAAGDSDAWNRVYRKARNLVEAQRDANLWARASDYRRAG